MARSMLRPASNRGDGWVAVVRRRAGYARRLALLAQAPLLSREEEDQLIAAHIARHGVTRVVATPWPTPKPARRR
jgi:hypothetical protein